MIFFFFFLVLQVGYCPTERSLSSNSYHLLLLLFLIHQEGERIGHVYIQDAVNFQGSEKLDKYILALIADHSSSTDRSNYPEIIKLNEMGRWSTAPEMAGE